MFFWTDRKISLTPSIPNMDTSQPFDLGLSSKSKHATRASRNPSLSFLPFSLSLRSPLSKPRWYLLKNMTCPGWHSLRTLYNIPTLSASVGMETPKTQNSAQHSFTNTLITISLQILLWSSLFPLSVQISLFGLHKVDKALFLTDVICIAAVSDLACHTKSILT